MIVVINDGDDGDDEKKIMFGGWTRTGGGEQEKSKSFEVRLCFESFKLVHRLLHVLNTVQSKKKL